MHESPEGGKGKIYRSKVFKSEIFFERSANSPSEGYKDYECYKRYEITPVFVTM